jgi:hypothetical protein
MHALNRKQKAPNEIKILAWRVSREYSSSIDVSKSERRV